MQLEAAAQKARRYTSDSRLAQAGDVFVAMEGAKTDGHHYVQEVLARNPVAVVVRSDFEGNDPRLIKVADVRNAHRELARHFRKKFKGKLVAIGGSNGKTTTKEFVATLLSEKFKIIKTEKSQNGELGIPRTLEQLTDDVEIAVVEVGIDAPGDMTRHADILQPDIAVLTSIGEEHLNLLKTVDNVFTEEKVLFSVTLARGGKCFAPVGDPWLARLQGTAGISFVPMNTTGIDAAYKLQLGNVYAEQNAALAIAVFKELGGSQENIVSGLAKLKIPDGRGDVLRWRSDLQIVADHYNANPSSMRGGLAFAVRLATSEGLPLRLILGDMLDLGNETARAHESIVEDIFRTCPTDVLLVGPEMSRLANTLRERIAFVETFPDSRAACGAATKLMERSGIVFLKGSRGTALEHCLSAMEAHSKNLAP